MNNNLIILTGPPGSGKTTLIEALRERGIVCVDEYARRVIAKERQTGGRGTSEQDPALFIHLMAKCALDDYTQWQDTTTPVVFDRGLPDLIAYAGTADLDPAEIISLSQKHRYNQTVLYTPPWSEIYTQDEERRATYEQTEAFARALERGYDDLGYKLIEVPKVPFDERIEFAATMISTMARG